MSNLWPFYMLFMVIMISQHNQARRRRQMGPRVLVDPDEFLRLVEEEKGLVINNRKMYVARCGDYYYYTTSKTPLPLPKECVVQRAKGILL